MPLAVSCAPRAVVLGLGRPREGLPRIHIPATEGLEWMGLNHVTKHADGGPFSLGIVVRRPTQMAKGSARRARARWNCVAASSAV